MENIEIIERNGVEYVIIDWGNNEFTSMTKERWDELEAQRLDGETL